MVHYKIFSENPQAHYINVLLTLTNISAGGVELQLPAWRPGRYELGNFAKNIKGFEAFSNDGIPLTYLKINNDKWLINNGAKKNIIIKYHYYASEINAGSCYVDDRQLYINPVHLCMYVPEKILQDHIIELVVPEHFKVATSLRLENKKYVANSFDELADSPLIASSTLQSDFYEVNNIRFWLHFNGECRPDFEKIKFDFIKFTRTQFNFWGDFPVKEYHFLFQVLPYKFYHGVEHQKSTVVAIGPGYSLNSGKVYESLLGVSSHELFHTWNVKFIRPAEMLPYDFTKENYARTGYVYEGFTTYYGDVMLLASGVFTNEQYFETLEERIVKHFHNDGRFYLSVAQSGWDTWLDGYVPGAPGRKTSIYDEGNLVAFMLDVLIMQHTKNKFCLKDVCRTLYNTFGKNKRGYTEQDIIMVCEHTSGVSLATFFADFVYGTKNFTETLVQSLNYLGVIMEVFNSVTLSESAFGFKTIDFGNNRKISAIAEGSPASLAGLSLDDEILAANGTTFKNDFNEWLNYFGTEKLTLTVSSNSVLKSILLNSANSKPFYNQYKLKIMLPANSNFDAWIALNS